MGELEAFIDDADVRVFVGDALDVLGALDDESVHAVLTSPPFFGLRDYGTGEWEGGAADCDHVVARDPGGTRSSGLASGTNTLTPEQIAKKVETRRQRYPDVCGKCGARRLDHQIGLEAEPDEWAESLRAVFAECRRVLRRDGTLWVECGDSYASKPRGTDEGWATSRLTNPGRVQKMQRASLAGPEGQRHRAKRSGLKEKDLVLAPMLLAMALRDDGWVLRGVYPWWKPDAMPESTDDRCTTDFSYLFHFARSNKPTFWVHRDGRGSRRRPKPDLRWLHRQTQEERDEAPADDEAREWRRVNLWRGRDYYFDKDAIREPFSESDGGRQRAARRGDDRYTTAEFKSYEGDGRNARLSGVGGVARPEPLELAQPTLDGTQPEPERRGPDGRRKLEIEVGPNGHENYANREGKSRWPNVEGRSPRAVWRVVTEASSFGLCPVCRTFWAERAPSKHCGADVIAHFATWPHELVRRVLACATSEAGVCGECGAPAVRQTASVVVHRHRSKALEPSQTKAGVGRNGNDSDTFGQQVSAETVGWGRSCACDAPLVPATVLDPFLGSGTTARQARLMGVRCVGIELNPDYAEIAWHRLAQQSLVAVPLEAT